MRERRCLFLFLFIMCCSLCGCHSLSLVQASKTCVKTARCNTDSSLLATFAASGTIFLLICQGYEFLLVSVQCTGGGVIPINSIPSGYYLALKSKITDNKKTVMEGDSCSLRYDFRDLPSFFFFLINFPPSLLPLTLFF